MRARRTDPETSHAAAAAATLSEHDNFSSIMRVLNEHGVYGQTTHELEVSTGIQLVSISPCMKPMEKMQLVTRTERRRTWKKPCTVWVARAFASEDERRAADERHNLLQPEVA